MHWILVGFEQAYFIPSYVILNLFQDPVSFRRDFYFANMDAETSSA